MADAAESQAHTPPWLDKGLWVAVLTPLCIVLSKKLGLALDAAEIAGIVLPIVAYVGMHKWKSGTVLAAEIARDATLPAPPATANVPAPPSAPTTAAEAAKALDAIPSAVKP